MSETLRPTSAPEHKNNYREGREIYAKNEGKGKKRLYIEKALEAGKYTLRYSATEGQDLLKEVFAEGDTKGMEKEKVFAEKELKPKPWD